VLALLAWLTCATSTSVTPALASRGDQQPEYVACVAACERDSCERSAAPTSARVLGLVEWPCPDECRYTCMHAVEAARVARGEAPPAYQYHGKWPFARAWGVQEPLSALFSLMNAAPNAYYLAARASRFAPREDDPTTRVSALAASAVALATWASSFLFHAKETWLTERLDYHMAMVHVCASLQFAVTRLLVAARASVRWAWALALVQALGMARHVWYMNFVSFDYGHNTRVLGAVVAAQAGVWAAWYALVTRRASAPPAPHAALVLWFQLGLLASASLELVDFPPLARAVDAHALWHLATVPLTVLWYRFSERDAAWRVRVRGTRKRVM